MVKSITMELLIFAEKWQKAGALIIGGCCGTTPEHIKAMRCALEKCVQPVTPDLSEITANIGPFSSESDGTDGVVQRKRIRRGGR